MNLKIFLILIWVTSLWPQNFPDVYYRVFNKDSLFVFTSNKYILSFTKQDVNQPFVLQSVLPGSYNASTDLAISDNRLLVKNNDTLYLYDITINPPSLICTKYFGFPIGILHSFGPYFIVKSSTHFKLLKEIGGDIQILEDSFISNITGVYYPLIVNGFNVYKYVEGFGLYHAYIIDLYGNSTFKYVTTKGSFVYSQIHNASPGSPPDWCGIIKRELIEPELPITFSSRYWGNLIVGYSHTFYSGSERFIYWKSYDYPQNTVITFTPNVVYIDTSNIFEVNLTDDYIFLLGPKILFSNYTNPGQFTELNYTLDVENSSPVVDSYFLSDNYPNPFNSSTTIDYYLPQSSNVKIGVSNILGEVIAILTDEYQGQGFHKINFSSDELSSGVYYYWLKTNNIFITKKMVVLKWKT